MKPLILPLKKKWFDLIKSGEKKEEYREIKGKYLDMFCQKLNVTDPNKYNHFGVDFHLKWPEELGYDTLIFTLGYPKADDTERRLVFKNPRIRIGTGRPEWGAKEGVNYFCITWEEG